MPLRPQRILCALSAKPFSIAASPRCFFSRPHRLCGELIRALCLKRFYWFPKELWLQSPMRVLTNSVTVPSMPAINPVMWSPS